MQRRRGFGEIVHQRAERQDKPLRPALRQIAFAGAFLQTVKLHARNTGQRQETLQLHGAFTVARKGHAARPYNAHAQLARALFQHHSRCGRQFGGNPKRRRRWDIFKRCAENTGQTHHRHLVIVCPRLRRGFGQHINRADTGEQAVQRFFALHNHCRAPRLDQRQISAAQHAVAEPLFFVNKNGFAAQILAAPARGGFGARFHSLLQPADFKSIPAFFVLAEVQRGNGTVPQKRRVLRFKLQRCIEFAQRFFKAAEFAQADGVVIAYQHIIGLQRRSFRMGGQSLFFAVKVAVAIAKIGKIGRIIRRQRDSARGTSGGRPEFPLRPQKRA